MELFVESMQLVTEHPHGLATLGSCEHIFRASFSNGILQQCEDADEFGGSLDIEVVHGDGSYWAFGVVGYGFL